MHKGLHIVTRSEFRSRVCHSYQLALQGGTYHTARKLTMLTIGTYNSGLHPPFSEYVVCEVVTWRWVVDCRKYVKFARCA
jgi:hypothetical protein